MVIRSEAIVVEPPAAAGPATWMSRWPLGYTGPMSARRLIERVPISVEVEVAVPHLSPAEW
jgi:hypothetical protein